MGEYLYLKGDAKRLTPMLLQPFAFCGLSIPRGIMLSDLFIVKSNVLIVSDRLLAKGIILVTSNMKCVLYELCSGKVESNATSRNVQRSWPSFGHQIDSLS